MRSLMSRLYTEFNYDILTTLKAHYGSAKPLHLTKERCEAAAVKISLMPKNVTVVSVKVKSWKCSS